MRLQLKVTLAMLFAMALLMVTSFAVLWYAVFPSYLELEEAGARRNVGRIHAVLDEDVASLARMVTDWATWDDTYQFVAGGKPSFVGDNVTATAVANLNISILYAEDAARRPVLAAAYDRAAGAIDTAAPESGEAFASAARALIDQARATGQASGLVLTGSGLVMAAARGIQPSDLGAPANGILVFGRVIDEEVADSIRRRIRLPLTFEPLPQGAERPTAAGEDVVLSRTDATLAAESVLRGVDGRPLMLVRSEMPRSIVTLGSRTLTTAALSLVLFAVVILFLLWVALRRAVIQPIQLLTSSLAPAGGPGADGAGHADEIATLADALKRHVELQRALADASAARRAAEEANRVKSLFLAQMSHELRTPLHAVLGFSEIMERQLFGPLGDKYQAYAARIHASGTHLLNLINDILDISKVEAGEFEVVQEPVDVADVLAESVQLVRTLPASGTLRIATEIPRELPMLSADARRLRQVVVNLLSNAVKFTPQDGHVRLRAAVGADGLTVSVQDTGVGIAPEHLDRVLKPFGQVDNSLTRRHEGTGLGLPLAKELSRLMGGTLTIDSAPGAGTTVSITFPAERLLVPQPQD